MENRFSVVPLVLCVFALTGEMCFASSSDTPVQLAEKEFNSCKREYQDLVGKINSELRGLKAEASFDFPAIYKKKQDEVALKAKACKRLKADLEEQRTLEIKAASLLQIPPEEKTGPKFRCFQLGQNWSEFDACAKSLGYSPRLAESTKNELLFTVNEGVITAKPDKNGYIVNIQFDGGDFWGTSIFDNHFIQAFVDHYDITGLSVDQMIKIPGVVALGVPPMTYYKGNILGGTICIIPALKDVLVEKTTANSGYLF